MDGRTDRRGSQNSYLDVFNLDRESSHGKLGKGAFNNYVEIKSGGQWKVHDGSRDKG